MYILITTIVGLGVSWEDHTENASLVNLDYTNKCGLHVVAAHCGLHVVAAHCGLRVVAAHCGRCFLLQASFADEIIHLAQQISFQIVYSFN